MCHLRRRNLPEKTIAVASTAIAVQPVKTWCQ